MEKIQISEMLSLYKDPEGFYHLVVDNIHDTEDSFRSALYPVDSGGVGIKLSVKTVVSLSDSVAHYRKVRIMKASELKDIADKQNGIDPDLVGILKDCRKEAKRGGYHKDFLLIKPRVIEKLKKLGFEVEELTQFGDCSDILVHWRN